MFYRGSSLHPVKQTGLLNEASIIQRGVRHSFPPRNLLYTRRMNVITKEGLLLVILEEAQLRSDSWVLNSDRFDWTQWQAWFQVQNIVYRIRMNFWNSKYFGVGGPGNLVRKAYHITNRQPYSHLRVCTWSRRQWEGIEKWWTGC